MPPKEKPKEYVCVTPCWHLQKKWKKGERGKFLKDQLPVANDGKTIRHFEEVDPLTPPDPPGEELVTVNQGDGTPVKA